MSEKNRDIKLYTYDLVADPGFNTAYFIPQKELPTELTFPTIDEFINKENEQKDNYYCSTMSSCMVVNPLQSYNYAMPSCMESGYITLDPSTQQLYVDDVLVSSISYREYMVDPEDVKRDI